MTEDTNLDREPADLIDLGAVSEQTEGNVSEPGETAFSRE